MYKNKYGHRNNICGIQIRELRLAESPSLSQKGLADKLQLMGLDLDKNAIQRIESGARFITDLELITFAEYFQVDVDALYKPIKN